jgi:hypothetical protein
MDTRPIFTWLVALITGLLGALLTLISLQKVDNYPLYTMQFYGDYETDRAAIAPAETASASAALPSTWACSLFVAFHSPEGALFGRNFDWEYSPALLLFAHPPDGYDSVTMVDLAYLGFADDQIGRLDELPLRERGPLLDTPGLPFDGMNEYGLVIGMAAVPYSDLPSDPARETAGSLGIIRAMLDHARTVDEALAIFDSYNVTWEGGPPLHYLMADATGRTVLVEFYQGERVILPLGEDWGAATNFLRAAHPDPKGQCWRYDRLAARLSAGQITTDEALALLSDVAQPGTQWSIIYGLANGEVQVAMHQQYDAVHRFTLTPAAN